MDPYWPNNLHEQNPNANKLLPIITYVSPQQHPIQNGNANNLQNKLTAFWNRQQVENEHYYGSHSLPLSRIKKIMKSDESVRMISAEALVLLSKACDMFMQDLTLRAWVSTEESKRRTLQKSDITAALSTTDLFDFLVDIVPRERPIVATPPVMQSNVWPQMQLRDGSVGEGSGVGLSIELPMKMVRNEEQVKEIYGSLFCLPYQSVWPPPPDL